MTVLSRRSFLGGLLTVSAVAAVPIAKLLPTVPQLWGDGDHDDTAALQALFDRKQVEIMNDCARLTAYGERSVIHLRGGVFRLSRTLVMRSGIFLSDMRVECARDFHGGPTSPAFFATNDVHDVSLDRFSIEHLDANRRDSLVILS